MGASYEGDWDDYTSAGTIPTSSTHSIRVVANPTSIANQVPSPTPSQDNATISRQISTVGLISVGAVFGTALIVLIIIFLIRRFRKREPQVPILPLTDEVAIPSDYRKRRTRISEYLYSARTTSVKGKSQGRISVAPPLPTPSFTLAKPPATRTKMTFVPSYPEGAPRPVAGPREYWQSRQLVGRGK